MKPQMKVRVTVRFDLPCVKDGVSRRQCCEMQDAVLASSGVDAEIIWRITNSMNAISCLIFRQQIGILQNTAGIVSVTEEQLNLPQ